MTGMTVAALVAELTKLPQDLPVELVLDDGSQSCAGGDLTRVEHVTPDRGAVRVDLVADQ